MIFYVFQREPYKIERAGNYIWAPKRDKAGKKRRGYSTMLDVHKGDFILHSHHQKLVAISVAQSDCYEATQPTELAKAKTMYTWADEGYRIDCKYFDLRNALPTIPLAPWLAAHYVDNSAFKIDGTGNLSYMNHISDEHVLYILNLAKETQTDQETLRVIDAAIADALGEKNSEYDASEKELIDELVDDYPGGVVPPWTVGAESQEMKLSTTTGKLVPKRNPKKAADALAHARFQCEFDNNDRLFIRNNGRPYTEPHHLIPICRYQAFNGTSVDVMENIVSLCSHCHNLLHYGRMEDKRPVLEKLYNDRQEALRNKGLELTLEQLIGYYK